MRTPQLNAAVLITAFIIIAVVSAVAVIRMGN